MFQFIFLSSSYILFRSIVSVGHTRTPPQNISLTLVTQNLNSSDLGNFNIAKFPICISCLVNPSDLLVYSFQNWKHGLPDDQIQDLFPDIILANPNCLQTKSYIKIISTVEFTSALVIYASSEISDFVTDLDEQSKILSVVPNTSFSYTEKQNGAISAAIKISEHLLIQLISINLSATSIGLRDTLTFFEEIYKELIYNNFSHHQFILGDFDSKTVPVVYENNTYGLDLNNLVETVDRLETDPEYKLFNTTLLWDLFNSWIRNDPNLIFYQNVFDFIYFYDLFVYLMKHDLFLPICKEGNFHSPPSYVQQSENGTYDLDGIELPQFKDRIFICNADARNIAWYKSINNNSEGSEVFDHSGVQMDFFINMNEYNNGRRIGNFLRNYEKIRIKIVFSFFCKLLISQNFQGGEDLILDFLTMQGNITMKRIMIESLTLRDVNEREIEFEREELMSSFDENISTFLFRVSFKRKIKEGTETEHIIGSVALFIRVDINGNWLEDGNGIHILEKKTGQSLGLLYVKLI